ncbi:MAG: hypothetical protein ABIE43_04350 [Patescibacteria group bacterium]
MHEIKKIENITLANMAAVFYALISFFVSIIVSMFTMAEIIIQNEYSSSIIVVTLINIGAGVLLGLIVSLVAGCIGWIMGYMSAIIYNMFARRVGGVKISLEQVDGRREDKKKEEGKS